MSLGAQTFLVVNDDSLAESTIRAALPATTSIRFVSLRDALDSAVQLVTDGAPVRRTSGVMPRPLLKPPYCSKRT